MEQLIRFGEVKRGRLGISMQDVAGGEGAQVADVQSNSPAAQAGLKIGDVVIALNGRPVRGAAELRARLSVVPVGESVDLRVQRGKEARTLPARIGELEKGQVAGGLAIGELPARCSPRPSAKGCRGAMARCSSPLSRRARPRSCTACAPAISSSA